MPIKSLTLDPENARRHDGRSIGGIAASLEQFGQRTPLVVHEESRRVIKGNGTLLAALQLGHQQIAVVQVRDDPAAAAGYAVADNRTAELSTWDLEQLARAVDAAGPDLHRQALHLDELLELDPEPEPQPNPQPQPPRDDTTPRFRVHVYLDSEAEQADLYQRLKAEGHRCRVVTQ